MEACVWGEALGIGVGKVVNTNGHAETVWCRVDGGKVGRVFGREMSGFKECLAGQSLEIIRREMGGGLKSGFILGIVWNSIEFVEIPSQATYLSHILARTS